MNSFRGNGITVLKSFPKLDDVLVSKFERELLLEFEFNALPDDYRGFLLEHNGGIVFPNDLEDGEKEFQDVVRFTSPLQYKDGSFELPSLIMMYTVWLEDEMRLLEDEIEDWDLYSIIPSNVYSREMFDVLPNQMMSIGLCNAMGSGDVIALSLANDDFGSVYYLSGMATHPAMFFGDFFVNRIDAIYAKYGIATDVDLDGAEFDGMRDEIKRAYFVKVADSFDSFWSGLRVVKY